ncbi:MAG: glutamate racemase [Ferruginibacter sp.]|nr:glutamate racemase [Ferruginibacter sp.]
MKSGPIGVFDSGYGGLTILKEIVATMPGYDYVYLGDNARAPYGTKSYDTVYEYTLEAVKWFLNQGCSLVILACNTASAKALRTIQQKDLPIIDNSKRVLGVIRPTSEVIGHYSNTGHVGILGTTGTVHSDSYLIEIAKFFPQIKVTQEACPEWVSLVEENKHQTSEADFFVKKHIDHILTKDESIDTLLLACTHYPLLLEKIKKYTPGSTRIISQGKIIADSLMNYLKRHPEIEIACSKNAEKKFYTTGKTEEFNSRATTFFGAEVRSEKLVL